jgi:ACS family tartrate transporter-like MFS transporter
MDTMAESQRGSSSAEEQAEHTAINKASWRLLPFLCFCYGIAYIDRVNISFAALQMNQDLHFSATVYGLGGGLFFLSYAAFEVPSNLLLIRFGARRWIARIMLTWGVLAVGMMFVKTPLQFYLMRFLLGAAEAGFFPGVLYYLTKWFPAECRGRAVSRFYLAYPLSAAFMGAVSGSLLSLHGQLGLAGWQWLFLVEGAPAIMLSAVVLLWLPDGPERAAWLTTEERAALNRRLTQDIAALSTREENTLVKALLDPRVLQLGVCNLCYFSSVYAFSLSAPVVLAGITHWDATTIGFVMSLAALLGALTMVLNGWLSDRSRERHLHVVMPLILMAGAFVLIGVSTTPWIVVAAYVVTFMCMAAVQAVFWLIPTDILHGRSAAIGLAAIGSIGMFGAFIGPFAWGLARDRTGSYKAGLIALSIPYLIAAIILLFMRQSARAERARTSLATIGIG